MGIGEVYASPLEARQMKRKKESNQFGCMRKAEEKNMQVFLCPSLLLNLPPTSALRGHPLSVAPWRRRPEARDANDAHSQGQRLPYPPESSIIRSDALVDPPARRTRPRLDISGHPHHWFRVRSEWQEERFFIPSASVQDR